ncbi:hypothetical protein C8Q77DRAFT_1162336 [Trametes polyzona]|nr:hypothetical protein C8Q77DRAFT_1162336 [Trametes polyzona]
MGGQPILPLEIIYTIIENLQGDGSTIRACMLSGKAVFSCAQATLYRDISFTGSQVRIHSRARRLSRTLRAHPSLGSLVQSLTISGFFQVSLRTDIDFWHFLTPLLLPFSLLTDLRALTLTVSDIADPAGFMAVVAVLPRLERLVCNSVNVIMNKPDSWLAAKDAAYSDKPLTPFPQPKHIILKHINEFLGCYAERLLLEHENGNAIQLEDIELSAGYHEGVYAWVPVIRASGSRLRHLSIAVTKRLSEPLGPLQPAERANYSTDYAYVLDNIAHCPNLTTLRLIDNVDLGKWPGPHVSSEVAPQSSCLLSILCDTLDRDPPPFPLLSHITLLFMDREGDMHGVDSALCARFARALHSGRPARSASASAEDAAPRYPRLRRLTVRVLPQVWLERVNIWTSQRPKMTPADCEAVVDRWRAAFAPAFDSEAVLCPLPFSG